jgi:hypothetical protein
MGRPFGECEIQGKSRVLTRLNLTPRGRFPQTLVIAKLPDLHHDGF